MSDAITPGARVGPYEIVAPIGSGGMGEVHRARDTKLNRDVAIKVLPDLFALDPDRLARFQREAQVLAALNHPNIAQIYGIEDSAPAGRAAVYALVMEFVDGDDLAARLTRGPLPLDEAISVAAQIADALETAHEQGIIHRDLKPANVKVRPDGTVKVLDFGLAKAMDPTATLAGASATMSPTLTARATQLGTIIGTAAYMAPEQAKGKAVDRRADIWSFGVVLYETLAGQRAFKGEDVSDTLAAVLRQDVDLTALPKTTPQSLRTLIGRCLVRDPRQRLRDIGEARVLLAQLRAGAVDEEKPPASAPPAVTVGARPLWKRALVPTALTIVGAAAAAYGAWTLKPDPPRPVTRFTLTLPADQTFSNTGRKFLALSPDGSHLAYLANRQIFLRALSGFEAHVIPGSAASAGGIHYLTFSPNGQELAYREVGDGLLKRLHVAGGAAVTIAPIDAPNGLVWTDQGIFFGVRGKGILRVPPNGGTPEVVASVGADEMPDAPDVLPDGRTLLFSVKKATDTWDKGQVVVQALDGSGRKTVINGGADAKYVTTGHLVYAVAGVLLAVPFDLGSLSVTGGPVSVVEGVRRAGNNPGATATAQYAISATGSIAYVPGPSAVGDSEGVVLAVFDRKGPQQPLKVPPGPYHAPRVSPDGRWVALVRENEAEANVWLYELAGTTAIRRLTFGGRNGGPVWSGDSRWVAFPSDREGDTAIYRQLADGTGTAERLTKPEAGAVHIPQSWSPDNQYLLYTEQRGEKYSLRQLSIADRRSSSFAGVESAGLAEAVFSPDGKWVAYAAAEQIGTFPSTYVVPFPPTGAKYVVPIGGGHPFWSPKGDALYMNVGPSRSAAVSVRTRPQFGFGPPEIFQRVQSEPNPSTARRNADAMPDGRIIGITNPTSLESTTSPQINVVVSWQEELKQRVR